MKTMKKAQDGGKLIDKPMRGPGSIPKEKPIPTPPPGYGPKKSGKLPSKPIMKAKSGKSFPDLNKDGKITKADILKGRGVIAQNGKKMQGVKGMSENEKLKKGITKLAPVNGKPVKKAAIGALLPLAMKAAPMVAGMFGGKGKGKSGGIGGMLGGLSGLMGGKNGKTIKKSRSGSSIKKAQDGYSEPLIPDAGPMVKTKVKQRSTDGNYVTKTVTRTRPNSTTKSTKTRRTLKGFFEGAPQVVNKRKNGGKAKSGTSMKKCKGGC
jgi:hypothetical protein